MADDTLVDEDGAALWSSLGVLLLLGVRAGLAPVLAWVRSSLPPASSGPEPGSPGLQPRCFPAGLR